MPRTKNAKNATDYKYKVIDEGISKYYISQRHIQDEYDMKRTAVYFMIHSPDRIRHKKNITIEKLPEPLPVYVLTRDTIDNALILKYEKIIY